MLQKQIAAKATAAGAPRTFRFRLSDGSVDRQYDRINPQGWRLDNYLRAPVVLWSHDHRIPAIAKCTAIGVEGTGASAALVATCEFAPAGLHPLADQVHDLVASGIIASSSVGFMAETRDVTPNELGGNDIHAQELIEWSIVNAGALPTALLVGRSANATAIQKWLGGADPDGDRQILQLDDEPVRRAGHSRVRGRPLDDDGRIALTLDDDDADVVALVLRGGRRISLKAGARHSQSDRALLDHVHRDIVALGSRCEDLSDVDDSQDSGEDGAELVFDEDLEVAARAAYARQRRQFSDPLGDRSSHRHHIAGDDQIDIDPADLRAALAELLPDIIREGVRGVPEAAALALRRAAGRVD